MNKLSENHRNLTIVVTKSGHFFLTQIRVKSILFMCFFFYSVIVLPLPVDALPEVLLSLQESFLMLSSGYDDCSQFKVLSDSR